MSLPKGEPVSVRDAHTYLSALPHFRGLVTFVQWALAADCAVTDCWPDATSDPDALHDWFRATWDNLTDTTSAWGIDA